MKKYVFITVIALFSLTFLLLYQVLKFNDGKLHVIFCDVGQGDAILVKTPSNKYILVDAGPDKHVLDCLARHMPMWEREIDLALLTHPHLDHFMGFHFVKDRYRIKTLATEQLTNVTPAYQLFVKGLTETGTVQRFVLAGDQWDMGDGVDVRIAGPTQTFLDSSSPGGTIGETKEFASLVILISYGSFRALLTGDSQASGLTQALAYIDNSVTVLQAPHHGSASGLDTSLIEKLAPTTAVISVGKNNYGHPTLTTLQLLKDIRLRRTDKEGDIVFVSGGD